MAIQERHPLILEQQAAGRKTVKFSMLAKPFNEKRIKSWPVACECKIDGIRGHIIVRHLEEGYDVKSYTRAGIRIPCVPHIEQAVANAMPETSIDYDIVLDGEFFSGSFKETNRQVRKQNEPAINTKFIAYDFLNHDDFLKGKTRKHFKTRRADLVDFFRYGLPDEALIVKSEAVLVNNMEEIQALFDKAKSNGHEGLIVKLLNSPWTSTRSWSWMKIKHKDMKKDSLDLPVLTCYLGEGKYSEVMGNMVVVYNGVNVGVGTGFTDAERKEIWEMFEQDQKLIDAATPNNPVDKEALQIVGKTVEVEYMETTPDGSLREPVFKGIRIDK